MIAKIPVIGPPPSWKWFPPPPKVDGRPYSIATYWAFRAEGLWRKHFVAKGGAPPIYWSERLGKKSDVHARTYRWGIVLSRRHARGKTIEWMEQLLLHEALHWAGYSHDRRFREAAKRLGTW